MKFITNLCTENWEVIQFKESLLISTIDQYKHKYFCEFGGQLD